MGRGKGDDCMESEAKVSVKFPQDPEMFFRSNRDFEAFLDREVLSWKQWAVTLERASVPRQPMSHFDRASLVHSWDNLKNRTDRTIEQKADHATNMMTSREAIYSKSTIGNAVLALADTAPDFSLWMALAYSSPHVNDSFRNVDQQRSRWFWSTLTTGLLALVQSVPTKQREATAKKASLDAETHADSAAQSASDARKAADDAQRSIDELIAKATSVAGDVARQAKERSRVQLGVVREEWGTLKRTYNLKMQTRAPYTYWRQKQVNHGIVAKAWMRTFALALALGALAVSLGAGLIIASGPFGPWPWVAPAVCLGVPAFASLWVARLANRQYTANVLRAEDAGERAVMVRTLLALSEKSDRVAGDAEFLTMVSALFRPGPGLATEDSPAVGALDAAVKALQGQPDRNTPR